jgi:thymidylate kinase
MPTPAWNAPAPWIVVTGLDGAGKTTLTTRLASAHHALHFRLPYHDFVGPALTRSGQGTPFGDVHTDRLIFAADARLTNYLLRDWRQSHPLLVSQRGWMDNFIFGAVQGVSYVECEALLRSVELERASAIIYLVAEPEIAFERIQNDPERDKYETLDFLHEQRSHTLRFQQAVVEGLPVLAAFHGIPALVLDTTNLDADTVVQETAQFLKETTQVLT